jgi:hypothetical protein
MVRRRAAMTEGETREKNTGSSLYSRQITSHIETPCRRIRAGSTRSRRSFSHSWRIFSCSRIGGRAGGIGTADAACAPGPAAVVEASAAERGKDRSKATATRKVIRAPP